MTNNETNNKEKILELRQKLDDLGVNYHHMNGIEKLQQLLNENTSKEVSHSGPVIDETSNETSDKTNINNLLEIISEQKKEMEALNNKIEDLVDVGRLDMWKKRNSDKIDKSSIVHINVYEGKVIQAWDNMITNKIYKADERRWVEDQSIKIYFEDGESKKLPLTAWSGEITKIKAKVVSETLRNNERILELLTEDEKTYNIDVKFIN